MRDSSCGNSLRDMLYRRRMERQLAQARGLMSTGDKMPPSEDDVSHLSLSCLPVHYNSCQQLTCQVNRCLLFRTLQCASKHVSTFKRCVNNAGRGRGPAPGGQQAGRLRAAEQARGGGRRGRQHAPARGELRARHQPV